MTDTRSASGTTTRRPVRQLLAASVGNAVEWYDWYAYTFLATYIAAAVFPKGAGNSLVPLLSTFGTDGSKARRSARRLPSDGSALARVWRSSRP